MIEITTTGKTHNGKNFQKCKAASEIFGEIKAKLVISFEFRKKRRVNSRRRVESPLHV
jgi:hypothetical protein